MNQTAAQKFISKCGQALVMVENEMPIGEFHDFLMKIKGLMVERMVVAQKQQEEEAKAAMAQEETPPCEGGDCSNNE